MYFGELDQLQTVLRLLLATAAGGMLGLERTRKLRPAGLRTYMLISVGSCLVMLSGLYLHIFLGTDPVRMAAQVVSGIGFIGAGTILTTHAHQVKGLTTAAGLWAAACLGLTIGAGMYLGAVVGFGLVAFILWFADRAESRFSEKLPHLQAHILFSGPERLKEFSAFAKDRNIRIGDIAITDSISGGVGLTCTLHLPKGMKHAAIMEDIAALDGVFMAEALPN